MGTPGAGLILLIEDEATSREIFQVVLEGAGYEVEAVETAGAAHQCLSTAQYDLVIADWVLPDGDGILLADRAAGLRSATVIVTGHISDLPAGVGRRHHLLTKPVKPAHLLAVVRAIIGDPAQR